LATLKRHALSQEAAAEAPASTTAARASDEHRRFVLYALRRKDGFGSNLEGHVAVDQKSSYGA
jgi:hypothetical protein